MSSPSRTFSAPLRGPRTKEGLAYDDSEPFEASRFLSRHVGRAASGDSPKPSHHALFCALSRYGVIWEDRSTCDGQTTARTSPARPMAGRQAPRLCPLCKHPPEDTFQCLRSGRRCRKMINHPVCPSISRSALCGANSWLFVALARSNQLLAYFTHRLPTALPSPLSSVFSEEEGFAVISQCYEPTLLRFYPERTMR